MQDLEYQLPDFPKNLIIELTNICNLNCDYCPRQYMTSKLGFMSWDLFETITKQITGHPEVTIIPFWRGESGLHPQFTDFMQRLVRSPNKVILATNGTTNKIIYGSPNVIRRIDNISVSLHNPNSLVGLVLLTLGRGDYIRPKLQISAIRETFGQSLMDHTNFSFLKSDDSFRRYSRHTIRGRWGKVFDEPQATREEICPRLLTDLAIAWDGHVSRCCYVYDDPMTHDLNANSMTLDQIWNSKALTAVRDIYPDKICLECDQWRGNGRTL